MEEKLYITDKDGTQLLIEDLDRSYDQIKEYFLFSKVGFQDQRFEYWSDLYRKILLVKFPISCRINTVYNVAEITAKGLFNNDYFSLEDLDICQKEIFRKEKLFESNESYIMIDLLRDRLINYWLDLKLDTIS